MQLLFIIFDPNMSRKVDDPCYVSCNFFYFELFCPQLYAILIPGKMKLVKQMTKRTLSFLKT